MVGRDAEAVGLGDHGLRLAGCKVEQLDPTRLLGMTAATVGTDDRQHAPDDLAAGNAGDSGRNGLRRPETRPPDRRCRPDRPPAAPPVRRVAGGCLCRCPPRRRRRHRPPDACLWAADRRVADRRLAAQSGRGAPHAGSSVRTAPRHRPDRRCAPTENTGNGPMDRRPACCRMYSGRVSSVWRPSSSRCSLIARWRMLVAIE